LNVWKTFFENYEVKIEISMGLEETWRGRRENFETLSLFDEVSVLVFSILKVYG
jgi:hypothetical protein